MNRAIKSLAYTPPAPERWAIKRDAITPRTSRHLLISDGKGASPYCQTPGVRVIRELSHHELDAHPPCKICLGQARRVIGHVLWHANPWCAPHHGTGLEPACLSAGVAAGLRAVACRARTLAAALCADGDPIAAHIETVADALTWSASEPASTHDHRSATAPAPFAAGDLSDLIDQLLFPVAAEWPTCAAWLADLAAYLRAHTTAPDRL